MFNVWWSCTGVATFWEQIFALHDQMSGTQTPRTPEVVLLSLLPGSVSMVKKDLHRLFLSAARRIIPRKIGKALLSLP